MIDCGNKRRIVFAGQRGAGKSSLLELIAQSFPCSVSNNEVKNSNDFNPFPRFYDLEEPQNKFELEKWKNELTTFTDAIIFVVDGENREEWQKAGELLKELIETIDPSIPIALTIHKIDRGKPDFAELFEHLALSELLEISQASVRIFYTSTNGNQDITQFLDWLGEQICFFPRISSDTLFQIIVFRESGVPIALIGSKDEKTPNWHNALLAAAYSAIDQFSSRFGVGSSIKTLTLTSPDLDPRLLRVSRVICDPFRVVLITRGVPPEIVFRFGEYTGNYFKKMHIETKIEKTRQYTVPSFFDKLTESISSACPCLPIIKTTKKEHMWPKLELLQKQKI